jgi:hypothetical protein
VIITSLCRFLIVLLLKKRENFFGVSAGSSFPPTGCPGGCWVTNILPSFSIRSSRFVRTGDQSMSNWLGGGNSVMSLGFGGIGLLVEAAVAGVEGPELCY